MEDKESKENQVQEEQGEEKKEEKGEEGEDKPRWIDLFDRGSHRRYQMEYLRDKEYEEIIRTLRRGFSTEEQDTGSHNDDDFEDNDKDGVPFHIQIPAEEYFLSPDPTMLQYGFGNRLLGSTSFSSSVSESSFGASTITTSAPISSRKYLPPEVTEEKKRLRRRRTAAFVCCGVMTITLVAMGIGVILHFLLETGSIGGGRDERDSYPAKE